MIQSPLPATKGGFLVSSRNAALFTLWVAGACGAWPQDVVVGQLASLIVPMTHSLAQERSTGIQLAFQHVNAVGNVFGRRVRLQLIDDQFDPAQTLEFAQDLEDQNATVALIGLGPQQGTMLLIDERFMERNRIANFAPLTDFPQAQAAPHVFPVRNTFNDEVKAMFAHAACPGRQKVGFVYLQAGDDPTFSRLALVWPDAVNVKPTANVGFTSEPDSIRRRTAIDHAMPRIGDERPDAVLLIAVGPARSAAVIALRQRFGA